ncbi:MAG: NAD-dependent protein deacetylase [Pseudomonadota bacterium]|nr:NAD-dependent protein deacetylase [Pseudomonadota bacterium]
MADIPGLVTQLANLLVGRRVVALTGAGCSTESGIPDYRGPGTRERARNPVQYRAFVGDPVARQRYWARSMIGWPRFSAARPNGGHHALAQLERAGALRRVITQNVDRLHHAAGNADVIELHGALAEVVCLDCGALEPRESLQARLTLLNPRWDEAALEGVELAPDGDAELTAVDGFRVADCLACGGVLKPRVVFFGENVPRPTVDAAFAQVDAAEALLVVGTSLTVYSGLRFVRRAAERGIPVAICNLGPTRGDPLATLRVDAPLGVVLPALVAALS